jgi:hypothetical protein
MKLAQSTMEPTAVPGASTLRRSNALFSNVEPQGVRMIPPRVESPQLDQLRNELIQGERCTVRGPRGRGRRAVGGGGVSEVVLGGADGGQCLVDPVHLSLRPSPVGVCSADCPVAVSRSARTRPCPVRVSASSGCPVRVA